MKHRFVALVLALALLLVPFDVNAAENDSTIDMHNTGDVLLVDDCSECLEENSEIAPQYEPVCGSYAYHHMNSSGFGTVMKNNSAYLTNASAWQCSRCLLVMVTEGDLVYGTMTTIGKYAILYNVADPINKNGVFIGQADYYGYTSSNSLSGYRFYLGDTVY